MRYRGRGRCDNGVREGMGRRTAASIVLRIMSTEMNTEHQLRSQTSKYRASSWPRAPGARWLVPFPL